MGSEPGKYNFFLINFIKQQNIVKGVAFGIFSKIARDFMRAATGRQRRFKNYVNYDIENSICVITPLFRKF